MIIKEKYHSIIFFLIPSIFVILFLIYPLVKLFIEITDPIQSLMLAITSSSFIKFPPEGPFIRVISFTNDTSLIVIRGFDAGPLANSLIVASMVSLMATLIGMGYAIIMFLYKIPSIFKLLPLLGIIPLPFVQAYVVERMFNPIFGLINYFLSPIKLRITVTGIAGVFLYQLLTYIPLAYAIIYSYLKTIPSEFIESAQDLGAQELILIKTILIPMAKPAIITSIALLFTFSIDDVTGSIIFQSDPSARNTLVYQAYTYFLEQVTGRISPRAVGIVLILLIISVIVFVFTRKYIAIVYSSLGTGALRGWVSKWRPRFFIYIILFFILLIIILSSLPTTLSILYAFSNEWIATPLPSLGISSIYRALSIPWRIKSIFNTIMYTSVALVIILIISIFGAYTTSRLKLLSIPKAFLDLSLSIPIAIPGIVIAYSYFTSFKDLSIFGMDPVSKPWMYLIIAYAIRKLPYLYKILQAAMTSIPRDVEEAAFSLGANIFKTTFTILLPQLMRSILIGLWITSLTIITEVSTSITIGGLRGIQGFEHPAPLMYVVYLDMTYTGIKYGGASSFLMLLTMGLETLIILLAGKLLMNIKKWRIP
ncbi:MAG: hypothetical protein DRO15_01405 [Thermoprotei archaeon]|nr:MAG: hypothetical protein DRO15_01405 [Thermoprotei archaeon]